jgi:membrane protein DedA with SNARE-associated domain
VDQVQHWLATLPPVAVYLAVFAVVGIESLGVPLPGEIALVAASLLAATGVTNVWWVAVAASAGAIIGDSIGYAIGRRGGRSMLDRFGRRFPRHFSPAHLGKAEKLFARWGVWTVFFGRFVALLRILAGPLAGTLRVPYRKFLVANAAGGILWAAGTAFAIWAIGQVAEDWLSGFSWVALVLAVLCGGVTALVVRHRTHKAMHADYEKESVEAGTGN